MRENVYNRVERVKIPETAVSAETAVSEDAHQKNSED